MKKVGGTSVIMSTTKRPQLYLYVVYVYWFINLFLFPPIYSWAHFNLDFALTITLKHLLSWYPKTSILTLFCPHFTWLQQEQILPSSQCHSVAWLLMSLDSFWGFCLSSSSASGRMSIDHSWVLSILPTFSLQVFLCHLHVTDSQIHNSFPEHFTHICQLDILTWTSTNLKLNISELNFMIFSHVQTCLPPGLYS